MYLKMLLFIFQGGSGYARKISFENITLIASKRPIIIDQHYCNGRHDCTNSVSFYFLDSNNLLSLHAEKPYI